MKLLIHTCCADCLLKMIDSLKDESAEIVGYFYNPNIHPRSEYLTRLKAAQKICEENEIKLISYKSLFNTYPTIVSNERYRVAVSKIQGVNVNDGVTTKTSNK